mmetsp:Transcript_27842/g.86084  ORF Transcript_27842/g.86084 Transcript_27842/m.86084 type:complete len:172 (-) Transcript_27842:693-1208(-)
MKLTATLLFAACRCAVIGGANGATVDSSHLRGGSSPSSVDFEPVSAATIVRSNAALSRKKGGKGKGKRGKGKGGKDQDEDENTDDAPCDTTALEEALAECQKDSEACQKENAECDNQVQICTSLKEECEDKAAGQRAAWGRVGAADCPAVASGPRTVRRSRRRRHPDSGPA